MTIEEIRKLVSAVSTATQPNSVTPAMVGAVLDALTEYLKEKTDELVTSDKLSDFLRKSADLVNNLNETAPGKALDAAQGKKLKELIDGLASGEELENLRKAIVAADDVLEFAGDEIILAAAVQDSSLAVDFEVRYSTAMRTFVARKKLSGGLEPSEGTYYSNWVGGEAYGEMVPGDSGRKGREPAAGKLFVDTSENRLYRWNGSELAELGGTGGGTAEDIVIEAEEI